jgi:ABC-type glucose/galactose transport system permease subunit
MSEATQDTLLEEATLREKAQYEGKEFGSLRLTNITFEISLSETNDWVITAKEYNGEGTFSVGGFISGDSAKSAMNVAIEVITNPLLTNIYSVEAQLRMGYDLLSAIAVSHDSAII